MTSFEKRIADYMDAGFPILYLHTFEEGKAQEAIQNASRGIGHLEILEWDGTNRICDIQTGELKYDMSISSLADVLDDRMDYSWRQVFIFKNIHTFMDDPSVMARMKKMADLIHSNKLDSTLFIVSPLLEIPKELEKYITVVEMDYLTTILPCSAMAAGEQTLVALWMRNKATWTISSPWRWRSDSLRRKSIIWQRRASPQTSWKKFCMDMAVNYEV